MILSLLASIAGLLIIFSIIPQIIKIKKEQSAQGVAKTTYYMFLAGSLIMLTYAFIVQNPYMVVGFFVTTASCSLVVLQIRQYSK